MPADEALRDRELRLLDQRPLKLVAAPGRSDESTANAVPVERPSHALSSRLDLPRDAELKLTPAGAVPFAASSSPATTITKHQHGRKAYNGRLREHRQATFSIEVATASPAGYPRCIAADVSHWRPDPPRLHKAAKQSVRKPAVT